MMPSSTIAKWFIFLTSLALASAQSLSASCPLDAPLSCHDTAGFDDTCCLNSPGGQLLLTQFWDTDPSTGPADSWTIHGLWPDNCDGTWEEYCDRNRQYTNITDILAAKAPCILKYMEKYWKDYQGDDEDFWEHEFNKHGTCISTLDPSCYENYQPGDEVVDFFARTVKVFNKLQSYDWLAEAGIVPSETATYTLAEIEAALQAHHDGRDVIIKCNKNGELNELWYHFNVRGSVQTGDFVPADPVGSPSSCPATGIKYLPKYATPSPTTTSSTPTATPTSTCGTHTLCGRGRLYVTTPNASSGGFLISAGTWYRGGGTPATYTATPDAGDPSAFTLTTSRGPCGVQDDVLTCGTGVTPSLFGYDGTYLTYMGSSTFYSTALPSGTTQGVVYTTPQSVPFQVTWTPV